MTTIFHVHSCELAKSEIFAILPKPPPLTLIPAPLVPLPLSLLPPGSSPLESPDPSFTPPLRDLTQLPTSRSSRVWPCPLPRTLTPSSKVVSYRRWLRLCPHLNTRRHRFYCPLNPLGSQLTVATLGTCTSSGPIYAGGGTHPPATQSPRPSVMQSLLDAFPAVSASCLLGGLMFRSLAGASAFHTWPASHQTIQKDRFICDSTFPPTGDDSMIPPLFARTHHLLMCQLKGQCRRPLCSSAHVSLPYCNIYRRLISAPDLCICPSGTSVTPFIAVLYTLPTLGPSPM